jgi:hypothetical protein
VQVPLAQVPPPSRVHVPPLGSVTVALMPQLLPSRVTVPSRVQMRPPLPVTEPCEEHVPLAQLPLPW